jgi:hypothetical protein
VEYAAANITLRDLDVHVIAASTLRLDVTADHRGESPAQRGVS